MIKFKYLVLLYILVTTMSYDEDPMHEDWQCDEDFQVESAEEFFNGLDPEELEFMHEHMVPCAICGEMRPRNDPSIVRSGTCYLCSQSDEHAARRGSAGITNGNWHAIETLVERWERCRD